MMRAAGPLLGALIGLGIGLLLGGLLGAWRESRRAGLVAALFQRVGK